MSRKLLQTRVERDEGADCQDHRQYFLSQLQFATLITIACQKGVALV